MRVIDIVIKGNYKSFLVFFTMKLKTVHTIYLFIMIFKFFTFHGNEKANPLYDQDIPLSLSVGFIMHNLSDVY
jgi:hypothetical protein